MRNKNRGTDDIMHVTRIDDPVWLGEEAKRMSSELLRKEHRGPGDTIEAAAHRLQTKHRVDASIILQGWQRPAREMKVSRWMSVSKLTGPSSAPSRPQLTRKSEMALRPIRHWLASRILSLGELLGQTGSRRLIYAAAAAASVLFLASIIFDADAYTGHSGRPTIQRATAW